MFTKNIPGDSPDDLGGVRGVYILFSGTQIVFSDRRVTSDYPITRITGAYHIGTFVFNMMDIMIFIQFFTPAPTSTLGSPRGPRDAPRWPGDDSCYS